MDIYKQNFINKYSVFARISPFYGHFRKVKKQ